MTKERYECVNIKHLQEATAAGLKVIGPGKNANYRSYQIIGCRHEHEFTLSAVRNKQIACRTCLNDRIQQEAKDAGLTVIANGKNTSYRLYEFDTCGHKKEFTFSNIPKIKPVCDECFENSLIADANMKGLVLLGKSLRKNYRKYRFVSCAHEADLQPGNVRNSRVSCKVCLQKRFVIEAKQNNLKIIGEGRNSAERKYRFDACSHEQTIAISAVRVARFRCNTCINLRFKSDASAVGLELLGPSIKSHDYRTYRCKKCSVIQEIRWDGVRNNYFSCHGCEETSRDQPSLIYLLRISVDEYEWLKLGYAKDIDARTKKYGLPKKAKISQIISLSFETGREAHLNEAALHLSLESKRLPMKSMKTFHRVNGSNECYPIEALDEILKKFDSIFDSGYVVNDSQ